MKDWSRNCYISGLSFLIGLTKPAVILIGGVPGTGKTTIAGHIARSLNWDLVFGGDMLREFLRGIVSRDNYPIMFSSIYDCWRFKKDSPTKSAIVSGFEEQAALMNKGVRKMIERSLKDGESLILEYVHLVPSQLAEIRGPVFKILLTVDDPRIYRARLLRRTSDKHVMSDAQRLVNQIPAYRVIQTHLKTQAERYGVPIYSMDFRQPVELSRRIASEVKEVVSLEA